MRASFARLIAVGLGISIASSVHAQTYPSRPIRVLVGPGPDIVARLFAPKMSDGSGRHLCMAV